MQAEIDDENGVLKTKLEPTTTTENGLLKISLGDLKTACKELVYGDVVTVNYRAFLSEEAPPGKHDNVALLVYDLGQGEAQTVGVMAVVNVPAPEPASEPSANTGGTGISVPKTWDTIPSWVLPVAIAISLVAAIALVLAIIALTRRRDPNDR